MSDQKKETRNSLIGDIAARAKVLADEKIDYLRRSVATENSNTEHAMWAESRHRSKGDMIEEILIEEFQTEIDVDFESDDEDRGPQIWDGKSAGGGTFERGE